MTEQMGTQYNTPLARSFRSIVTAGWANVSDGNVEAPTGHFSLVNIEPAERIELVAACLQDGDSIPYPGHYLVVEDSDGNTELIEFVSLRAAQQAYLRALVEFTLWDTVCPKCENWGPHERLAGNTHQCVCGETWDPVEDMVNPFENLPLSPQHEVSTSAAVEQSAELSEPPTPEKLYLVCRGCGEACDEIQSARDHGAADPASMTWCGEDGFDIMPESEAL